MNIILLGYNGLLGSYILKNLVEKLKNDNSFNIICVSRNIKKKPFKSRKISYLKWDYLNFSKSKLFFLKKKNTIINCIGKNSSDLKSLREANFFFIQKLLHYIKENKIKTHLIHLGSVSVYDVEKKYLGDVKNIKENSKVKGKDYYSKSKLEADICIQNNQKKNNKKLSYTILRIANVFSYSRNSNAFILIRFLLKKGIWLKTSKNTRYHFIHAKDVALSVILCIFKPKLSKNKIYIISDDINQFQLHKIYAKNYNLKLLIIPISLKLTKMITKYFILPKKIINFFLTISSEVNYCNNMIKKELNFKTLYSLKDKIL